VIKVTNKQILQAQGGFAVLAKSELPIKVAFQVAKESREITTDATLVNALTVKVIEECGGVVNSLDGSATIAPTNPAYKDAISRIEELMAIEQTYEFELIKLPMDTLMIKPEILLSLEPFIEMV